ncbi:PREDICTED: uncharacterized protein LOC105555793 [Vollenhovia emeryi]|uniref:uncharacterized protein LOC105555793 n=1 Tax=Vollenhovia emeryi TaxID=411798 RepID=UPI0005F46FB5|nr:PREDICTED: uncharacterized protein LOC105555793 [Vollenhovia emeryi]
MKQNPTYSSFFNNDRSKWIINTSDKTIPKNVMDILSLGDKFGLPFNHRNSIDREKLVLETIKNVELNSYKITDNALADIRSRIAHSLHNFLRVTKQDFLDKHILNEYAKCNRFLRDNDDVLVTKADKGQVTVIMNKNKYKNQIIELLQDQNTYKKLNNDPIKRISNKMNDLVKSWRDNDIIDERTYRYLNCTNGNIPRCYGLPKLHKQGFPLRIIVSTIGSPLYNIACIMHNILNKAIPKPKSHIKDSWAFTKLISNKQIHPNNVLISLDVTAPFTNIPKELVMTGLEKRWQHIREHTKLNLAQFLYAIDLILNCTCFTFDGQPYEQIFGSPLGSPLSPILADIVMDDLETQCLSLLDFEVPYFFRYVDDIFMVLPQSKIPEVIRIFNTYHPRLSFTHETDI